MHEVRNRASEKMKSAFFSLIEHKHYSKITVTELIETAEVSRTTFYRHYKDLYDMYDKVCADIVEDIMIELVPHSSSDGKYDLAGIFELFCGKIAERMYYISLLCGKNGGKKFLEIGSEIAVSYVKSVGGMLSEREIFALKFVTFSCISTYVKCIIEGTPFNQKNITMYKKILAEAQKAGGSNG